ncbi:helix-turn-helix transcriptional regulator [Actinophytocola oryzae]|uniref:Regulatory LuxR family protein n=1 Tax=Actinophytocola oryzae TaxID=502181 RepID=A0A4R7VI26_9PSEU|nr:LuxR C-terminal-related transcriptional regulator [Actinophytocola oryzae]TDV48825.1 regulatory LuxR family protein [Actinophytocola oryzae]
MHSLRTNDLRAVLDYSTSTLRVASHDQVPPLLAGLARLVGSDSATLTRLDLRTQDEVAVPWPPARPAPELLTAYAAISHTHPLRAPLMAIARRRPARIVPPRVSDVLTARGWRATRIHREAMPATTDQLCLPLRFHGDTMCAITLSRTGGTFTDRQRDMLAACAEHLRSALVRARPDTRRGVRFAPYPAEAPVRVAPALSTRERQIVELVATGRTDAQIARLLDLRPATVSKHLHRVYLRHNLRNRTEAVRLLDRVRL